MKLKDCKTGEIFQNIEIAQRAYCNKQHSDCSNCCLSITNNSKIIYCYSLTGKYPREAAILMDMEIYDEPFAS